MRKLKYLKLFENFSTNNTICLTYLADDVQNSSVSIYKIENVKPKSGTIYSLTCYEIARKEYGDRDSALQNSKTDEPLLQNRAEFIIDFNGETLSYDLPWQNFSIKKSGLEFACGNLYADNYDRESFTPSPPPHSEETIQTIMSICGK